MGKKKEASAGGGRERITRAALAARIAVAQHQSLVRTSASPASRGSDSRVQTRGAMASSRAVTTSPAISGHGEGPLPIATSMDRSCRRQLDRLEHARVVALAEGLQGELEELRCAHAHEIVQITASTVAQPAIMGPPQEIHSRWSAEEEFRLTEAYLIGSRSRRVQGAPVVKVEDLHRRVQGAPVDKVEDLHRQEIRRLVESHRAEMASVKLNEELHRQEIKQMVERHRAETAALYQRAQEEDRELLRLHGQAVTEHQADLAELRRLHNISIMSHNEEVARLEGTVADLELEVTRLKAYNEHLIAAGESALENGDLLKGRFLCRSEELREAIANWKEGVGTEVNEKMSDFLAMMDEADARL